VRIPVRTIVGSVPGFLVALTSFVVYVRTLAPTVTFIDSGELAAVASTLGVAHPTGYPLFTLLGWVFSRLPFIPEPIVGLNLMAALFCSAGVYLFYHSVVVILTAVGNRRGTRETAGVIIGAAGASLLLAFFCFSFSV
jgi:hypothetical protein